MALVANLDRDLFPPADIYQIYRLRWQVASEGWSPNTDIPECRPARV